MFSNANDIRLGEFEEGYFESLPDSEMIATPTIKTESYYHTIFVDNERAGIVGFIPVTMGIDAGFIQIVLSPDFRGMGLLDKIYQVLVENHKLKTLYGTIKKDNKISIRAHEKIGFKILPEEKLKFLRDKGLIGEDEIRLEKTY